MTLRSVFGYFDVANGQGIFTSVSGSAPNRIFNVEWRARFCCSNGPPTFNFEIRLYEGSQRFDIIYGQMDGTTAFATVGVQRDFVSGCFTQFACSQPNSVFPGLKLSFSADEFDFCIQDDTRQTLMQINSTTGAYSFTDCSKGLTFTGQGQISTTECKFVLSDNGPDPRRPDRSVSVLVNTCTAEGEATIRFGGTNTAIRDSDITNNTCGCP